MSGLSTEEALKMEIENLKEQVKALTKAIAKLEEDRRRTQEAYRSAVPT
jgi:predicted  nucleic acid-binding Zn-ribbon protein